MEQARYEYLVAQVQQGRVTFLNGKWIGKIPYNVDKVQESLEACPWTWEFLNHVGAQGWMLSGTAVKNYKTQESLEMLYLSREVPHEPEPEEDADAEETD